MHGERVLAFEALEDLAKSNATCANVRGTPMASLRRNFYGVAAVLDALVALNDREWIESEAPKWTMSGTYYEPFAMRALGFGREDGALLEKAAARFEAMELCWHAEETRRPVARS
jgi:hypothetical protein